MRTFEDLIVLNQFFTGQDRTSNSFFRQFLQEKGLHEMLKVYKCIKLQESHKKGEVICRFGEIGDTFYVVLRGIVGVKVPTDVNSNPLPNYLDAAKFIA
jgi:hypothetical protein